MKNRGKGAMERSVENKFFVLLLGIVTVAFFLMLVPFWGAIFWAIALAISFYPVYLWCNDKLKDKPSIASLLTVLIAVMLIVIPLIGITAQVVNQASNIYEAVDAGDISAETIQRFIESEVPIVPDILDKFDINIDNLGEKLTSTLGASSEYIAQGAVRIGQRTGHFLISMAIMLYLAFFFLRDGESIANAVAKAIPLGNKREHTLSKRFVKVTRATLKSTFIVAAVEGILGWFILVVLGIPGAVLLGVLIAVLSLIPAIGAFLVWGPVAIYLFVTGDIWQAVVLVLFGSIIIGLADNVLRPMLVGRDIRLPDWLILLSILGGLGIFGVHGFIIGPIVAALFITLWNIFMKEFDKGENEE